MMRRLYIHQQPDWPHLHWRSDDLLDQLAAVRHRQGCLLGRMADLGFDLTSEAVLNTLTDDVVKSSEIEGETLDAAQVRSSVARRLGLDAGGMVRADQNVAGMVDLMLDATENYAEPLTKERLWDWQAALFPTGRSGLRWIKVGQWRDDTTGPMQVVSGPMGREKVHFEAPAAERLDEEMERFLDWFNAPSTTDEVLRAGVAHLWFVTVHPFEDGNGRLARAITDLALARSENTSQRFYSMSSEIRRRRNDYYRILESTQKGGTDITAWLTWFLACMDGAIAHSERALAETLAKGRFWQSVAHHQLNNRQNAMLNRLLDDFEGNLTTAKWAKISKCSSDTALRDITDLMERGLLIRNPKGGRSTSYTLAMAPDINE